MENLLFGPIFVDIIGPLAGLEMTPLHCSSECKTLNKPNLLLSRESIFITFDAINSNDGDYKRKFLINDSGVFFTSHK